MMLALPGLLDASQVRTCRAALEQAQWTDGRSTAGHLAMAAKDNEQLPLDHPLADELGRQIVTALTADPLFISAALPLRILPPRFNRYRGGGQYGNHIDNAIFQAPGSPQRVRSDISTTVFLSDPAEYEGGELVIHDTFGERQVKLPAGHAVLYPGTSLHRVAPVTRGTRYAAFCWTQSLVRSDTQRALLFEQDVAIQRLTRAGASAQILSQLTGVYHNLLRMWSEL